jgi:UDP-N-acetylglucosamine transferase subunit ALG13
MHPVGFSRLVEEMDHIAAQIDEEVVMQIGTSPYRPRAARWFTFTTQEEMEALCERARVIVSHAGSGSILTALRHRKPLIVVPRRQKYGEHIDDHQLELAEVLSQAGSLLVAYESGKLAASLEAAESFTPQIPTPSRDRLIEVLRQAVLTGARRRG